MARVCQITGKKTTAGNNVSHSNRKTKRVFRPNLHKKRFFSIERGRYITLRVSRKAIKLIDKHGGIDGYIAKFGDKFLSENA